MILQVWKRVIRYRELTLPMRVLDATVPEDERESWSYQDRAREIREDYEESIEDTETIWLSNEDGPSLRRQFSYMAGVWLAGIFGFYLLIHYCVPPSPRAVWMTIGIIAAEFAWAKYSPPLGIDLANRQWERSHGRSAK